MAPGNQPLQPWFVAATVSATAEMTNKAVHSLMDTLNHAFLFHGMVETERPPDAAYTLDHGQITYLLHL